MRELTDQEFGEWGAAVSKAVEMVPSFRSSISILRPFYAGSKTGIDPYGRVGLSKSFFKDSLRQQATTVLHLSMHILYRHNERQEGVESTSGSAELSADLEIGTTLSLHPRACLDQEELPEKYGFEPYLNFEKYHELVGGVALAQGQKIQQDSSPEDSESFDESDSEDSDGEGGGETENDESNESEDSEESGDGESDQDNGADGDSDEDGDSSGEDGESEEGDGDGEGDSKGCGGIDRELAQQADDLGIERPSDSEISISQSNTEQEVEEAIAQDRYGMSHAGKFLGKVHDDVQPPKVDWRTELLRSVARVTAKISNGMSNYTYTKVNKRMSQSEFIFPAMIAYRPEAAVGMDQSGSMKAKDRKVIVAEIADVLKNLNSLTLKFFTVDTKISGGIQKIRSIEDMNLSGGGGTEMSPAFREMRKLGREQRPDVVILGTDGGVPWDPVVKELELCSRIFKSFILITNHKNFEKVPQQVRELAHVVDISE